MIFAERMNKVKASAIRDVQKKIAAKGDVISFAAGLPDPYLFPLEDLTDATNQLLKEHGLAALQYGPTKGHGPLIEILVKRMKEKEGIEASAENVIITTGSQQGIALSAMIALDKGDVVIAENPSYLGGINACRPYECSFVGVDTDDEGMIISDLEKALNENPNAKIVYVIPNFQNPAGRTWSYERRKEFIEVINKHDVLVLEDNPYGEIRFKGEHVPAIKSLDTQDKVIYLGSFSKVLCPGLRVAWACGGKEVIEKMELLKQGIDLQSNQFAQMQILEYLNKYDLDAHIDKIKCEYKTRCELMLETMEKEFPAGVEYTKPEGGMFVWVELPEEIDATKLLDEAIDSGVAYVPGEAFYANEGCKNTMRLNFSTMSEEQIVKGIKILADVFNNAIK